MPTDILANDRVYTGAVAFAGTMSLPASSVQDTHVAAGADIATSKMRHRHALGYSQKDGTDVVTETMLLHVCNAGGDLMQLEARVTTAPIGGDKQFTVNLQKASNGSGSWTNLLTAVVTFAAGDANNTKKAGTITATSLTTGDAIRVVITASGTTGSQGQGLVVRAVVDEKAQ